MGDRASLVGVEPHRELAEGQGLEVVHEIAPDLGVIEPREEQQAGRLGGTGRHHHVAGGFDVVLSVGVYPFHAGGPPVRHSDLRHHRLGAQLGPPRHERPAERCDGVALGVYRAPEERAEAAVVAGRPAIVGDRVARRGAGIGVVAQSLRGGGGDHRAVHRGARWHRVGSAAPGGEGIGTGLPGHPDQPLGFGVVGLQFVVAERPVGDGGALHRPELGEYPEVLFTKARHLAVGMDSTPADGCRQVVHLPDVTALAVGRVHAECPWFQPRVGSEEVTVPVLDLVVGELVEELRRLLEIHEVVLAAFEDEDRPARRSQRVGGRGTSGSGADDDGVEVTAHGSLTSSSV